ncbi:energy-coupling factor ABC transporter permease [Arthrobacter sp. 260]|uniref:energy-coupling factor ABC transporter permease n=1 Tax=Arthrobacter sp. 260 TaxID=2735314 RepID=UPI0014929DCF|nr:energy-coupling factor ABC transporter permease [Arthrobacter sp. 260]NOJ58959.1 energy-coupling factor ABC transporter permease [Arthrobacter sp. 260]
MHLPDHFLSPVVSASAAVVPAGGVAYSLHRARAAASRKRLVLASVTTGFVFAAQMVNFSVLPGTSGHFMGGALAAALLGPWLGIVVVSAVLTVQALVFADGGLSALGANVLLMAVVGVVVATGLTALVRKVSGHPLPLLAAGLGAALSVPASALVFCALYAIGGAVPVPLNELVASMVGVHALIGLAKPPLPWRCWPS